VSESCHFCQESEVLERHHILPRRHGGDDSPENLVTVCPTCHRKLERLYAKSFYEALGVPDDTPPRNVAVDVALDYLNHHVKADPNAKNISTAEAYEQYRWYCDKSDTVLVEQKKFTELVKSHTKDFGYMASVRTPSHDYPVRGYKHFLPTTSTD